MKLDSNEMSSSRYQVREMSNTLAQTTLGGDAGQLRALAAHDAADERRQGVEVAGEVAYGRSRIGVRESVADGMIAAKVVTHRLFLLFSIAGGGYDEPTFKPGPAKNKIMYINSIR